MNPNEDQFDIAGQPLIILTGPTAVGKTALSVALAKRIGGEIISADSMQVYRGMDIGSAKVTEEERQGVPHHLIDVLDPEDEFNVVLFQKMAMKAIREILSRGRYPILVGGTGFYIQSVLYNIDFTENHEDGVLRRNLEELANREGNEAVHKLLEEKDPASAAAIHPNNLKRTIRALEYFNQTGEKISEHNAREREKTSVWNSACFVLTDDRRCLYERIDRRVDKMISNGLVGEVRELKRKGCRRDMVSMQGLGYKEILDYLDSRCTLEEAVYTVKRDSRHFAKRQLTWFRREKDVIWLDRTKLKTDEEILNCIMEILRQKGIAGAGT